MAKQPAIVAISGSEEFLQHRAVQQAIKTQGSGWDIQYVDGEVPGALEDVLGTAGGIFDDGKPILVVVSNPDKVKVETLEAHLDHGEPNVVVLLDHPGKPKENTKVGKFIVGLGKAHRSLPKAEKEWKQQEEAREFCMAEAKTHGVSLPEALAASMVDRLGMDLGYLSFEVLKACLLAASLEKTEITVEMLRGSIAPLNVAEPFLFAKALQTRDPVAVSIALKKVWDSSKEDPTMQVVGALASTLVSWLEIVTLREKGMNADEIVAATGKNPYVVSKILLPGLTRWSSRDLVLLIQDMAQVQRLQSSGAVLPWSALRAKALSHCRVPSVRS